MYYQSFLADIKGVEGLTDNVIDGNKQLIIKQENNKQQLDFNSYTTELKEINGLETVEILSNQAAFYTITKADVFSNLTTNLASSYFTFILDRYLLKTF